MDIKRSGQYISVGKLTRHRVDHPLTKIMDVDVTSVRTQVLCGFFRVSEKMQGIFLHDLPLQLIDSVAIWGVMGQMDVWDVWDLNNARTLERQKEKNKA